MKSYLRAPFLQGLTLIDLGCFVMHVIVVFCAAPVLPTFTWPISSTFPRISLKSKHFWWEILDTTCKFGSTACFFFCAHPRLCDSASRASLIEVNHRRVMITLNKQFAAMSQWISN